MSDLLDWTEGREALLFEACPACGKTSYFRRGFCPRCGATPVDTRTADGHGTVYAVTTVSRAPSPEWKALAPYSIVLVDLDDGVRAMTHGTPGLSIGDRVRVGFRPIGDRIVPLAAPEPGE